MRPRLLLADDDLSIRQSLRKLLQNEQYDVVLAANGKEAVEVFQHDPAQVDLVLTDLNMPLRNGWASINRMLEVKPLLPIILLTGMSNQREWAETSHARALVEKPIDVSALLGLIHELLAETKRAEADGCPPRRLGFHYVPGDMSLDKSQPIGPYSAWGLNELPESH